MILLLILLLNILIYIGGTNISTYIGERVIKIDTKTHPYYNLLSFVFAWCLILAIDPFLFAHFGVK